MRFTGYSLRLGTGMGKAPASGFGVDCAIAFAQALGKNPQWNVFVRGVTAAATASSALLLMPREGRCANLLKC